MDRKRKSSASSSTSTKKRTTTPRAAKRYRRVTELGGVRISNIRANGAKHLRDVKVLKIPNPRAGPGGFTIIATPRARIGDSGVIDGVRYVIRSEQELRNLIEQGKWSEVERTCTSRIKNMSYMFSGIWTPGTRAFNRDISHWDTTRVTNMRSMFERSHTFNQSLNGWNTSRVTDTSFMFESARAFNQPLGNWDMSKVTSTYGMFACAYAFNQPLRNWNVSRVTDMARMFLRARAFNQPLPWNTSSVTSMWSMFEGASRFNQPIGRWDVSRVTTVLNMFNGANSFRQDLSAWATRLPSNVRIDERTRRLIWTIDDTPAAFRARRYRLHPEANAVDPVALNRVNLDDAVVIAGDLYSDMPGGPKNKLRHIFSRSTTTGIFNSGRTPQHPVTRAQISHDQVVPLRDVLHANDRTIYNRVGTPAGRIQARTVRQVRESNARNARNAMNARRV